MTEIEQVKQQIDAERIAQYRINQPNCNMVVLLQKGAADPNSGKVLKRDTWVSHNLDANAAKASVNPYVLDVAYVKGVANMSYKLAACGLLKKATVMEDFDMRGVTSIESLFNGCRSIESLDLSSWDTHNITNMAYVFNECYNLKTLNLSGWDTSNVKTMGRMFYGMGRLEYLDISSFDLGKCTGFSNMLTSGCWRYIRFGQGFFKALHFTTSHVNFAESGKLGLDEDGNDNGWLAHFASVAPTIRSKEGYGTDENVPLLEEENGEWYLNDGIARAFRINVALTSKTWAQPYLQMLQDKGYTIFN